MNEMDGIFSRAAVTQNVRGCSNVLEAEPGFCFVPSLQTVFRLCCWDSGSACQCRKGFARPGVKVAPVPGPPGKPCFRPVQVNIALDGANCYLVQKRAAILSSFFPTQCTRLLSTSRASMRTYGFAQPRAGRLDLTQKGLIFIVFDSGRDARATDSAESRQVGADGSGTGRTV